MEKFSVEAWGLTKRFDQLTAVNDLTLNVREGEIFGLLGPNGSGKTTTVRLLSCLISPTTGGAKVAGFDISEQPLKVRENVGVLTENPGLYERLTALENMEFFAEAYGLTEKTSKSSRIRELLDFFDLWERRGDKVGTFSKGMRQKLAIAKAMVHRPSILFLDEPSSGLDPQATKDIRDLMERLSKQERQTIFLCTHNLEEANRLCSRVMIIRKGATIAMGSVDDLRKKMHGSPILEVRLKKRYDKILESLNDVSGVRSASSVADGSIHIDLNDPEEVTPRIVRKIVEAGAEVMSVNLLRPTLEDAYLELVKEGQ